MPYHSLFFTVTFFKADEFARARSGFQMWGGVTTVLGCITASAGLVEYLTTHVQYEARVVEVHADVFNPESGMPLEWNVTFERVNTGQKFTHRVFERHQTDDVVVFCETRKGVRRIERSRGLIPFGAGLVVIGCALIYVGWSGRIHEMFYWPPRIKY